MKMKLVPVLLAISLLLTGCSWTGKRYASVTPHREGRQEVRKEAVIASDSEDLIRMLEKMIQDCTETGVIYISEYPEGKIASGMAEAVSYAMKLYPLGAYAVEDIFYEVGTTGGLPAMAVNITYRHSGAEVRQIRQIADMEEAEPLVEAALSDYDLRLVMQTEKYSETDFQQMVRTFAETYPEFVMEIPQVTESVYGMGPGRVVELNFTYQTGRDSMRQMHSQVQPVFEAAELYVSGNGAPRQKYSQLFSFLMERFDYQLKTSITPAYSLLHHGVGDSRAFATVYAAMCRRAGLECLVVTGTRSGEPWVWNMVKFGDAYQHVDLLRCSALGRFQGRADGEMEGYVWDYSAYPECSVIRATEAAEQFGTLEEDSVPMETEGEETQPQEEPVATLPVTVPEETVASETP